MVSEKPTGASDPLSCPQCGSERFGRVCWFREAKPGEFLNCLCGSCGYEGHLDTFKPETQASSPSEAELLETLGF